MVRKIVRIAVEFVQTVEWILQQVRTWISIVLMEHILSPCRIEFKKNISLYSSCLNEFRYLLKHRNFCFNLLDKLRVTFEITNWHPDI